MDLNYYKSFCDARGKGNYVIDGIVNEEKWANAKPKVLFVLKETVGYADCKTFFMRDEIPLWLRLSETYPPIGKLALALQVAFSKGKALSPDEFKALDFSLENLFAALEKCAVIDLKKHSGSSMKSNSQDIKREYAANRELLQHQINTINPDIIVFGSVLSWECISDPKIGLFQNIPELRSLKKHTCGIFGGKLFYLANHPSAWTEGGFDPEKIHRQIFEQIVAQEKI